MAAENSEGGGRLSDAQALRADTGSTFTVSDCAKALASCGGDREQAVEWLTSGKWRLGKSVSWDMESLRQKAKEMVGATGQGEAENLSVLMDCAGNKRMAIRKMKGLNPLAEGK